MGLINRGAVVVKAKQPFLDWVKTQAVEASMTFELLGLESTVYLLPPWEDETDLQRMLEQCCGNIFAEELAAWITDESTWPPLRTWAVFCEWFHIEPSSMVMNLVEGPIVDEEDEDELVAEPPPEVN